MAEVYVTPTAKETVITLGDGTIVSSTVSQETLTVVQETATDIIIDLNSGPRGQPGSAILVGESFPLMSQGTVGDIFLVTSGSGVGTVYKKADTEWVEDGNIRGPAGGVASVNGLLGPDVVLSKANIALEYADNTSDIDKPISTATQAALNLKANANATVNLTGAQTIAGAKTFSDFLVSGSSTTVPTIPNGTTGTFSPQITATNTSLAGIAVHTPDGTRNRRAGLYLDDTNNEWGLGFTYSTGSAPFVIKFASTDAMSLTDAGVLTAPSFVGNGANLTALNGTQVTTGTVADARLSTNVATLTGTQTFSGAKTFSSEIVGAATGNVLKVGDDARIADVNVSHVLGIISQTDGANQGGILFSTNVANFKIAANGVNGTVTGNMTVTGTLTANGLITGAGVTLSSGAFTGSGSGITALNATNISTGTIADGRLSTNVSFLDGTQTFTGAKTLLRNGGTPGAGAYTDTTLQIRNDTGDPSIYWHRSGFTDALLRFNTVNNRLQFTTAAGTAMAPGGIEASVFIGSGASLTALNGTNISTGTVADLRLSSNVALLTGTQTFTGSKTFSLNAAFSAGITIPGTQAAIFDATGVGAPTLTTRSAGTKVVMYSSLTSAVTDYAIGIETANMWYSAGNAGGGHKWYTNTTNTMTLTSAGALTATSFIGNGTSLTALDGTNITSGTVADLRLSSNVMLLNGVQTSTGRKVFTSGTGTGTDYNTAPLEIRSDQTGAAPHLSFHWVSVVASQIRVASSGHIQIANNPGSALEGFEAADIYDTGNRVYSASNAPAISAVTGLQAALDTKAPLASPVLTGTPTAPTQATTGNDTQVATSAFVKAALLAMNPVGSIVFNVTNANPSTYIGGTWVAWGKGKVPVGIADSGTFAVAAEISVGVENVTLTAAQSGLPAHNHTQSSHSHGGVTSDGYTNFIRVVAAAGPIGYSNHATGHSSAGYTDVSGIDFPGSAHFHYINPEAPAIQLNPAVGAAASHSIVQPSIAVYMWKRTA